MLPKATRLPYPTFTGRPLKRARFEFGSVAFFPNLPAQVAVVVSKKVARSAVDRNRIRRRCLHALKKVLPRLSTSVVVYPTAALLKVDFDSLVTSLELVCVSR